MRVVFWFLLILGLLLLASCQLPSSGTAPESLARNLIQSVINTLAEEELPEPNDSPTEFVQLARRFVYTPDGDLNDSDVMDETKLFGMVVFLNFIYPATATEFTLLSVAEHDVKLSFPYIITDPPAFVEKVYRAVLQLETEDSTVTSIPLPIITVTGKTQAYFGTVFIDHSNGDTEVSLYPKYTPFGF